METKFCIYCGSKQLKIARFCSECGNAFPTSAELEALLLDAEQENRKNTKQDDGNSSNYNENIGEIGNQKEQTASEKAVASYIYPFCGRELYFPHGFAEYNNFRLKFDNYLSKEKKELSRYYNANAKDFDTLYSDGLTVFMKKANAIASFCETIVHEHTDLQLDAEWFLQFAMDDETFCSTLKYYSDNLEYITAMAKELATARSSHTSNRPYWQGGGFGVAGALKGAFIAGVLNLSTQGIMNSIQNSRDHTKVQKQIQEIYQEREHLELLLNAFDSLGTTLRKETEHILESRHLLTIPQFTLDRTAKAAELTEKASKMIKDENKYEEAIDLLCNAISCNPYFSLNTCMVLYRIPDTNKLELQELVRFLGFENNFNERKEDIVKGILAPVWNLPENTPSDIMTKCEGIQKVISSYPDLRSRVHPVLSELEKKRDIQVLKTDILEPALQLPEHTIEEVAAKSNELHRIIKEHYALKEFAMDSIRALDQKKENLLKEHAMQDDKEALRFAEKALENHNGQEALKFLRRSAEMGNADAVYQLGLLYYEGEYIPQDYQQAAECFSRVADSGNPDAQYFLGDIYENGEGVSQDYVEAAKRYRRSAAQGNVEAQYCFAALLEDGLGIVQDYAAAAEWYLKAADQGDSEAQYNLEDMYENGRGVPQDYSKAVEWYLKAADELDSDAMYRLGFLCENGYGISQNYLKAANWYLKATNQGNTDAAYNLACLYENGKGISMDYAKAAQYYRRAANKNNPDAAYNLACLYEEGHGVAQDYGKAAEWYLKAADQENSDAMELWAVCTQTVRALRRITERQRSGVLKRQTRRIQMPCMLWAACTQTVRVLSRITKRQRSGVSKRQARES